MSQSPRSNMLSYVKAIPQFQAKADSPRAFLERCLEIVEAREPTVQAFSVVDVEGARRAADTATERFRKGRPLSAVDGCVVGVKDIIETADMPSQMGNAIYAGWQPSRDALCVHSLREAGAVFLGKTVTTEFAIGRPGPTRNPHDPARTPGGSSSGSAAAVGAGMIPAALGTQTQSSVLRPASFCGAYGFKPTKGVLPTAGVHPLSATHDHVGIVAGSVQDIWYLYRVMAQAAIDPLRGLQAEVSLVMARRPFRLLLLGGTAWSEVDEETRAAFKRFLEEVAALGIEITHSDADPVLRTLVADFDAAVKDSLDIIAVEMLWPYLSYRRVAPESLGPRIHNFLERGLTIGPDRYSEMLRTRDNLRRRIADLRTGADGFISLASSGPAPIGLEKLGSRTFPTFWTYLGYPSCTLPLLTVSGMPVGVQLMGFPDQDEALLAHAAWIDGIA